MNFYQQDFGAGTSTTFAFPSWAYMTKLYVGGGGGGGGGGGSNGGGGGGGSGALGLFVFCGEDLGDMGIAISIGTGGALGAGSFSGGVPGGHGGQSTIVFPNNFVIIAGGGEGGMGHSSSPPSGYNAGQGGRGGNIATTGTQPSWLTFGQFNFSSSVGQSANGANGGWGAKQGDTSSGGRGGNANSNGLVGEGGYLHLEVYG